MQITDPNDWIEEHGAQQAPAMTRGLYPAFSLPRYTYRRRLLSLLGSRVDVFSRYPEIVLHSQQKAFRLREDIRLYSDPQKSRELLSVQARNIIDFSAAYDVTDRTTGVLVGTLRRKGWASMIRDHWEILDAQQNYVGRIVEDNLTMALLRRLLTNLIPQAFNFEDVNGLQVAEGRQHFNPFVQWIDLEISPQQRSIDPRLIIAATTLLVVIEGRSE